MSAAVPDAPDPGAAPPARPPETIDAVGRTADDVAVLVLGVPGVQRLHGGLFGEVATYLPGRRVGGVKIDESGVEVHVVLDADVPIRMTAERIHAVVAAATRRPVHVVVEDVGVPPSRQREE